jgi:pyruvate dehydrogenase E2 component (dihydrolipoamide acetyltransferase)
VKPGDVVEKEQSLVTLESDKATMDVPSSHAGVVKEVKVKVGDSISEGHVVILLEESGSASTQAAPAVSSAPAPQKSATPAVAPAPVAATGGLVNVTVPDIGDYKGVPVIEVHVKPGDVVEKEQTLVTLESDKATMDVPSSHAGVIKEVKVKVGDSISQGDLVVILESSSAGSSPAAVPAPAKAPSAAPVAAPQASAPAAAQSAPQAAAPRTESVPASGAISHASPSVRKYARELGVDVSKVIGTAPKGRISQEDVQAYVKNIMTGQAASPAGAPVAASGGLNLLPWPKIDFSKFGETETKPLSRIQKLSAANLSRNWVMIPAVTYHEDADITDLEAFRVMTNKDNEKQGIKVTMLAFLIKAAVNALKKYPEFNSSLDGDNLVMKKYFHIAFAADTPNGLVVPVVKNADKKGIFEIAKETGELAKLAREGKLKPDQMQGASFTISSLGGIGGTYFAPIINAPEVAILGVNKASMKPVWDGKQFVPKLICPLSLTADHRVIDGALATRFNVYLAELLADFRRVVL